MNRKETSRLFSAACEEFENAVASGSPSIRSKKNKAQLALVDALEFTFAKHKTREVQERFIPEDSETDFAELRRLAQEMEDESYSMLLNFIGEDAFGSDLGL